MKEMKQVLSKISKFSIFVLFFNIWIVGSHAQNNTMYWMKNLPQSFNLNPAKQIPCKLFIDVPVLPNFSVYATHSGFTINDVFEPHPYQPDSFIIDLDGIELALQDQNNINFEIELSILNLGFAFGNDLFATFGINYKTKEHFQYPKDLIELRRGNYRESGLPISFDFKQNLTAYREIFLGLSKDMGNGITIGGRLKLLSGYANIETNQMKIDWYTETNPDSMYEWTFVSDFDIKLSEPVDRTILYDSLGNFQTIEFAEYRPQEDIAGLIFPGNPGFAIDLGIEYNLNDRFIFSASLIDFGFIKWKTNPTTLTQQASFRFSGLDVAEYIGSLEEAQQDQSDLGQRIAQDMIDTLKTVFNPNITEQSYKTFLSPKFYLGADVMITDYFNLGLVYRGSVEDKTLFSAYTLSANASFFKGWSYSLAYSIINGKANNIGMGLAYKVGPWQMYLLTDNMALPFWALNESSFSDNWIRNTKTVHFAFGLNFLICKKNRDIGLLE
jgi:hypothetical protein